MVFFRLTWRGDVSDFRFASSSLTWLCSFGLGVLAKRPRFFLSYDVTSAFVRVPEPCAMMFLFQDGADDRKKYEHYAINACYVAGLLVAQGAICEVSATMVLSTSEVYKNSKRQFRIATVMCWPIIRSTFFNLFVTRAWTQ